MSKDLRSLLATLGGLPANPEDLDDDDHGSADGGGQSIVSGPQDLDTLLDAWKALSRPHRFQPGDLVRWKRTINGQCLANRIRPAKDEFAVVVGVLDTPLPLQDEDVDSGNPTWREPLDLQLGVMDDDGEFLIYHFDSSRFEPVKASAARQQTARRLRELQASLAQTHALQPGMLVRWKPCMKNRKWPAVGQAAVVMQVLQRPLYDPKSSAGTCYFHEPLDVVLGLVLKGEFVFMHTDRRRLEPLPDAPEPD